MLLDSTGPLILGHTPFVRDAAFAHFDFRFSEPIDAATFDLADVSTSQIDVSAKGYQPGHTAGNTTVGAATGMSGGRHALAKFPRLK